MDLLPAPWDIVPETLNVLMKQWPLTKTSYSILKGYSEHRKKFPDVEVLLLTPGGKFDPHATFLLVIPKFQHGFYIETLNTDIEPFVDALCRTPYLDCKEPTRFCTINSRLWPVIDAFIKKKGEALEVFEDDPTYSFHISTEDARKTEVKLPEDLYAENLRAEHAEKVHEVWPHNEGGAMFEVLEYIRLQPSIGLFKKDTKELVAWCLYLDYGGPGILQVDEKFKRRGYGSAALAVLTKLLGDLGVEPQAFITPRNKASQDLFKKLGYAEGSPSRWVSVILKK